MSYLIRWLSTTLLVTDGGDSFSSLFEQDTSSELERAQVGSQPMSFVELQFFQSLRPFTIFNTVRFRICPSMYLYSTCTSGFQFSNWSISPTKPIEEFFHRRADLENMSFISMRSSWILNSAFSYYPFFLYMIHFIQYVENLWSWDVIPYNFLY